MRGQHSVLEGVLLQVLLHNTQSLWVCRWTKGHVALLGDSAHAMQPNLGQGGCMAIEDGFQLSTDLNEAIAQRGMDLDIEAILKANPDSPAATAFILCYVI